MINLRPTLYAGVYAVGTGERGIHVRNRIKVGKHTYDPIYGMMLESDTHSPSMIEFCNKLLRNVGYNRDAPIVHHVNTIPNSKDTLGLALLMSNQVILYRRTLGVLVHELAHFAAFAILGDRGHRQGFQVMYNLLHVNTYRMLKLDDSIYDTMLDKMQEYNLLGIVLT